MTNEELRALLHPLTSKIDQLRADLAAEKERADDLDAQLTRVRVALTDAGVPDAEQYPEDATLSEYDRSLRAGGYMLSQTERIKRLSAELAAAKKESPHDAAVRERNAALREIEKLRAELAAVRSYAVETSVERDEAVRELAASRTWAPPTDDLPEGMYVVRYEGDQVAYLAYRMRAAWGTVSGDVPALVYGRTPIAEVP